MNLRWVVVPAVFAAAACAAGDRDGKTERSSSRAEGDDAGTLLPASCVRVTDIGTFAGTIHGTVAVTDVNERGEAVGYVVTDQGEQAFYWNGSQRIDLGSGQTFSINEHGEIALIANGKSFIWRNGTTEELAGLGGATAINDDGTVAGRVLPIEYGTHAAIWRDGTLTDLGVISGDFSFPMGLNERGQVLVDSGDDTPTPFADWHPFIWENGVVTDINPITGGRSHAVALSGSGGALVNALIIDDVHNPDQAALWRAGTATMVNVTGADYVHGIALNDHDAVVGNAIAFFAGHEERHAFYWQNGQSTFIAIPGMTPDDPGTPVRIDNHGVVAINVGAHAYAWREGVSVALEGGTIQSAMTMNQHGLIGGTISTGDSDVRTARLWDISRCFTQDADGGLPDAGPPPPVDAGASHDGGGGKAW